MGFAENPGIVGMGRSRTGAESEPVSVIYVTFPPAPDPYLNDNPAEQWNTCHNFL